MAAEQQSGTQNNDQIPLTMGQSYMYGCPHCNTKITASTEQQSGTKNNDQIPLTMGQYMYGCPSSFRPLRDFRCQRLPHCVCGLSAYLVRSPRLSPAHCSHYAPSPPPSVCRFPVPSSSQPAMPQSHAHTLFCSRFRPFTACSRVPRPISAAPSAP